MDDAHDTPETDTDDTPRGRPNSEKSAAAARAEAGRELEPQREDMQRRTERYYTVFNGPVHAGGLAFGHEAGRPRTGVKKVDDDELRDTLRHFIGPPDFVAASNVLHHHRLVILCGDRGTGRRCAGLALLTRSAPLDVVGRGPLVELPPRTTTAELLDVSFDSGWRYLLTEYEPGEVTDEQMRFELDLLRRRLAQAGAILVATSSAPAFRTHDLAVAWRPVDCCDILNRHMERHAHGYDSDGRALLQRIAAQRRPGEMPAFFDRLEQSGPNGVEQHFDRSIQNKLRGLITENPPPVSTLLPLVAAAFLPGAIERTYEDHLRRLRELVDRHAHRHPRRRPYDESLAPSRQNRAEWIATRVHPFVARERAVDLIDTLSSESVLTVLYQHYGHELWAPVHEWLKERPNGISGLGDEQALATGVAAYAQVDIRGASTILDAWAQGESLPHRLAAAAAISAMCPHETTVDDALQLAIKWTGERPRQQIAAAMAFGQALSRAFPVESMSYIWFLGLGNVVVARVARTQFGALVRAASRDDDQLRRALSIVDWQLEQLLRGQAYQGKSINQAIETVWSILSSQLTDGASLTSHVLRRLPDQISHLGALWAEVLRSWPHRTAALEALRTAHDELEDGVSAFSKLGEVVRQRLSSAEWEWVCRDLDVATWTPNTRQEVAA